MGMLYNMSSLKLESDWSLARYKCDSYSDQTFDFVMPAYFMGPIIFSVCCFC